LSGTAAGSLEDESVVHILELAADSAFDSLSDSESDSLDEDPLELVEQIYAVADAGSDSIDEDSLELVEQVYPVGDAGPNGITITSCPGSDINASIVW
jgi:hypothetical protein